MKYEAINNHFLNIIRGGKGKAIIGRYGENYALSDGYTMFIIPEKQIELNINRFEMFSEEKIKSIICPTEKFKYELKENSLRRDCTFKFIVKMVDGDYQLYCQEKYLRWFDAKLGVITYKNNTAEQPIYVYHNDVLCGLVLPIRHMGW
jgi:hypothetical protein